MIQSLGGWSFFDPTKDELGEGYPRRTIAVNFTKASGKYIIVCYDFPKGNEKENKYELEEENGFCHISIETTANRDIREELFYACGAAKLPIYEMVLSQVTLEDVFLELTEAGEDVYNLCIEVEDES